MSSHVTKTSLHVSETLVTPSCNVATLAKPCSVVRLEDRCYPPEFWGELVGIPREDFSGSTGICLVEVGDDDLLHLHHGLHGAIGLFAIGIAQVTAEGRGHNLSVAILRASSSARRIAAERPGASSTCGGADLETQSPPGGIPGSNTRNFSFQPGVHNSGCDRKRERSSFMRSIAISVCAVAIVAAALWQPGTRMPPRIPPTKPCPLPSKRREWIASVQGKNGGWGQDGGETSYVRQNEHLESNGNDVANTAVAALALRRAGKQYQPAVNRALDFIMRNVEESPADGLQITKVNGTQIQRKLGPYIDTFLTSCCFPRSTAPCRRPRKICAYAKRSKNAWRRSSIISRPTGSWNVGGGWAPILGTSMASRSLYVAQQKGVTVEARAMDRADNYTKQAMATPPVSAGSGGGFGGGAYRVGGVATASAASAGVPLYQSAQALEQLSRTEKDRKANAPQINAIKQQLTSARFVTGFGSMGGEEFFSYLNISDSLRRTGGDDYDRWHAQITQTILKLQNEDGTWAGQHCITGRVATTAAAILNLMPDRMFLRKTLLPFRGDCRGRMHTRRSAP